VSARLVRDNMPRRHPRPGEFRTVRNSEEHRRHLRRKLLEEVGELIDAVTEQEIAEEVADIFEVLQAYAGVTGVTETQIAGIARLKRDTQGTFNGGVIWEASP
jgi:predicted house-cleaning noncanonical NTP pyrophosphatase (MazG superfamily)